MDKSIDKVLDHLRAIADRAFELIDDIDARRKLIEQYFCVHPSTSEIHGQWYPVKTGNISMEWVAADGADPDRRILYISSRLGRLHAGLSMDAAKQHGWQGTAIVRIPDGRLRRG